MDGLYPIYNIASGFNLNDFYSKFKSRHEFGDSDLIHLRSKFPLINISNSIPTAWIIAIDDFLNAVKYIEKGFLTKINKIDQVFGFITVILDVGAKITSDILLEYNQLQKDTFDLDRDLYEFFDIVSVDKAF